MTLFMKNNLAIASALFGMYSTCFAGGMTSSGTDSKSIHYGAAWFLGTEPISYCIDIAPKQSVDEAQVEKAFRFAIKTWQDYMIENQVHAGDPSHQKINFNFQKTTCSPTTELKIYIGVSNSEIEKFKKLFENPSAFSQKISYDIIGRRGKGFIWFAPDSEFEAFPKWGAAFNLKGMMLHELGHVLGCEHIEHTIMDDNILSYLQSAAGEGVWASYAQYFLSRIDHHQFLLYRPSKKLNIKGTINVDHTNKNEEKRLFELLVDRKPKGEIVASVIQDQGKFKLTLKDEIKEVSFDISLPRSSTDEFSKESVVFKIAYMKDPVASVSENLFSRSQSTMTTIKSMKGIEYPIQVGINVDNLGWPVTIKILESGSMKSLFYSDLWLTAGLKH